MENQEEVEPVTTAQNKEEVELTTQQMEQEADEHETHIPLSTDQHEKLHAFQDSFTVLLQSPEKEIHIA